MKSLVYATILIVPMVMLQGAGAYELYTHAGITQAAFARSVLSDAAIRDDLGIPEGEEPFGSIYYDNLISPRRAWPSYEGVIINKLGVDPLSLEGWLMRGVIREDDLGWLGAFPVGANPHDDPYLDINRVVNHFFDPLNNKPLDVPGLSLVYSGVVHSAPNWAIGSPEGGSGSSLDPSNSNTAESGRRNHFTLFDGREAMFRALTLFGKDTDGTLISLDDGTWTASQRERERMTYWATTFRALGDVLHLNQDMAQPQHTRDEVHSGLGWWSDQEILTGHASELEMRADERAKQEEKKNWLGQTIPPPSPLVYDANPEYPIPDFDKYSDFWSTSPGSGSVNGKGLADYSNAGFYTPKYGFSNGTYFYPSGGNVVTMNVNGVDERFLSVSVNDHLRGGTDSVLELRRSIWDDVLESLGGTATYSMDDTNYDAMADVLIPRAVAYSAGIVNYFFRGKMQIDPPDEGVYGLVDQSTIQITDPDGNFTGFNKIKLKLSNITPNNDAMTGGKLIAVLQFRRDSCYSDDLTGYPPFPPNPDQCRSTIEETVVSDLANGGADVALDSNALPVEFNFQKALPINATDVRLQVIYRGKLGQEDDAVVVATKDIGEPTYFSYMNATDYLHIGSSVYTHDDLNLVNNTALLQLVQPQSCVDWNNLRIYDTCFQPITLSETFTTGSSNPVTTMNADVPVERFLRVAFLGDVSTPVTLVETQGTTCYPQGNFTVPPVIWQDYYDPATNSTHTQSPIFSKLRNVAGWVNASCVWSADGSTPDTPDDRVTKMSNVSDQIPVQTQISGF